MQKKNKEPSIILQWTVREHAIWVLNSTDKEAERDQSKFKNPKNAPIDSILKHKKIVKQACIEISLCVEGCVSKENCNRTTESEF